MEVTMYPDSYRFATRTEVAHPSILCIACSRLDGRPAAYEPHGALVKSGEETERAGQRVYYTCDTCGTRWTRLVKKYARGKAYYWDVTTVSRANAATRTKGESSDSLNDAR